MGTEQDEDAALIAGFLAGADEALAAVYQRWSPLVYSVALSSLDDTGSAERVTQTVFTTAWTSRVDFDPGRSQLSSWLIQLTRDTIAQTETPAAGTRVSAASAATGSSANLLQGTDQADRLMLADAIGRLAPEPREVLRLALFAGLTHTEIAERTHLAEAVVTKHLRRSLMTLRDRLEVNTDAR